MNGTARRFYWILIISTFFGLIFGFTFNPSVQATVNVDAVSYASTANASLTISHTTSGSNRLMLVGVSINNDNLETVSSITYNGVALSLVGFVDHQGSGGDDSRVEIWKLVDPPVGTFNLVITFSADLKRYAVAGVTTFTGVDQTDPLKAFAASYGDSNSPSLSVPSTSDELVLGVFACETCTSVSFSSPGMERWNTVVGRGNTIGAGLSVEGTSPEMVLNASLGQGDHWAMGGISIKPSGSHTPVANDDSAITTEDTAIIINVAANDTDPNGDIDPTSANTDCFTCTDPGNGTLSNNGDGSFTYIPILDFKGTDGFVYEICDTLLTCDTAMVSISVTTEGGNLPPVVSAGPDQTIGLFEDAILDGTVSDDGLPNPSVPVFTTWSVVSGPGIVTFSDAYDLDTTATFSKEGSYVLNLSANDGELIVNDQVIITVSTASIIRVPQDYNSIQAAIDAANNGDVVLVSPGTYSGPLTLNKAATLASWFFTTGDEANISNTILDGGNGSNIIDIPAGTPDRPTIMGFTIQNANDGISPHAKFDFFHNIVRGTSDGIDYESHSGGLCRFNIFESNSDDGIDLDGSVDIVITDNIIRNNGDDGIEIRMQGYAGPVLNIIISNNVISENDEDGIQIIDYSDLSDRFLLIERNLIKDNLMVGLGLMDNGDTTEDYRAASIPERIHVFNNTFVGNNYGLTGGDNLIAINNLFVNSNTLGMKGVDGNSIAAYNLFWNNGYSGDEHEQGSNLDIAHTLYADPLIDAESYLQSGSPAIDSGTSFFEWQGETVLNIPDGEFFGLAPDLGMYESDAVNDAPVVSDIPDQSIGEGAIFGTINLDDYVSDADNPDNEITWIYSGNTDLTVSISLDRVATIGIPNPQWKGPETITFTATDPGGNSGSDVATFMVTLTNEIHIGNIKGITDPLGKKKWKATVILTVQDSNDNTVSNAEINGTWSGGTSGAVVCITDINGICSITSPAIWRSDEVTFTVDNVSHATMPYDPSMNHATSITVNM
jgi:parallel beta-helix repeat protein